MGLVAAGALLAGLAVGCSHGDGGPGRDPAVPADAKIVVIFGLRRDDAGLAKAVRASSDPSSSSYGRFLSMADVAARFGASPSDRTKVLDVLADEGVRATVDASGGAVLAPMTPAQVHAVLGSWPQASTTSDGWKVAGVEEQLEVPSSLRGTVTEVAGARSTVRAAASTPVPGTPTTPPCDGIASAGKPSPLGRWYGYDDYLFADPPVRGDGRRIGILAIGRWNDASLEAVRACYRTRPSGRVEVVRAPATPRVPVGPEVALDVVVASSFAPDTEIDVVQYDPKGSLAAGFLQAVDASADGEVYDSVSTSIGYCETSLEDADVALTDHALLALAVTGTTVVASSGDTGSAACHPANDKASVQYPASSPWITSVGGTSVRADGTDGEISDEVVWSSPASPEPLAGGGGTSSRFDAPWYQRAVDPPGGGGHRTVPDVAFLADPSVVPPIPVCPRNDDPATCDWYRLAGTSAPAPALAAALSLVDQDLSDRAGQARRLGLLPPLVREVAEGGAAADAVHDVTEGSNRVLGLDCCDAGPGYDLASGWGSLVLPQLADASAAATR
jgi:kumamolisin